MKLLYTSFFLLLLFFNLESSLAFELNKSGSALNERAKYTPKEKVFLVPVITLGDVTTDDDSPELTGNVDDPDALLTLNVDGFDYFPTNNGDGTWTLENNTMSSLAIGTYSVSLLAIDLDGQSAEATGTLTIELGPAEALPASDILKNEFRANWFARNGVESYELEVSTTSDFSELLNGYNPLETTASGATLFDLDINTRYYYRLKAIYPGAVVSDYSNEITVKTLIDEGTLADSTALVKIYDALDGANWTGVNWKTEPRFSDWNNLFFVDGRVSDVLLDEKGLKGDFPEITEGLEETFSMTLQGNDVTYVPPLDNFLVMDNLNLANNLLEFESLENNVGKFATYFYGPQDSVLTFREVKAEIGSPVVLDRKIRGSQNVYTWFKIDPSTLETTEVGTGETLTLAAVSESDNGEYFVEIASAFPGLDELTLVSRKIKLEASIGFVDAAPAKEVGFFGFTASWFPKEGVVAYEIELSRTQDFSTLIDTYDPLRLTDTAVVIGGLNFATSYYYRIRAEFQGSTFTDYSEVVSVKTLEDQALEQDSSALMTIYEATQGELWLDNNWKSAKRIYDWSNIGFSGTRITSINLNGAGLTGSFPDIQEGLGLLETLDLRNNDLSELPMLSSLSSLQGLLITNNNLAFGSLENNLGLFDNYQFSPQDSVSFNDEQLLEIGNTYTLDRTISGSNNSYTWFKQPIDGGDPVESGSGPTLEVNITAFDQEGIYYATVKSGVAGLEAVTLTTRLITVKVSSLERDVKALLAIYNATDGANWSDADGWSELSVSTVVNFPNDIILTENNDRVIGVDLSAKGLTGSIPKQINDIGGLQIIDLSENALTGLASMTRLKNLTSVNVSNNFLDFGDLDKNVSLENIITYSPQAKIGDEINEEIPRGGNFEIAIQVGGASNKYQWLLTNDLVIDNIIETANVPNYQIDDISYESMGSYKLLVTNNLFPSLTLESNNISVLATATIGGLISGINDLPLPTGVLDAFKIGLPNQPYDTVDQNVTVVDGAFLTKQLVLGSYLAITDSDIVDGNGGKLYIPTYLGSTDLWTEADTIFLRNDTTITEYLMTFLPQPLPPTFPTNVAGVVESEFNSSGRILERRKVKKAGCSVRRFKARGRDNSLQDGTWELLAYVETNDNGEFKFNFLPPGTYRFNIEFPGIPMDPDSFVEFEIGAEGFNAQNFKLEAYITENGIEVTRVAPLGIFNHYFNDLKVYPVPAVSKLHIVHDLNTEKQIQLILTDLSGKTILQDQLAKNENNMIEIDISSVNNGIYMLRFSGDHQEEIVSYKILISH